ncbi:MAG: hypothetical protein MHPSP_001541, partial [Paramarteilia canceri]
EYQKSILQLYIANISKMHSSSKCLLNSSIIQLRINEISFTTAETPKLIVYSADIMKRLFRISDKEISGFFECPSFMIPEECDLTIVLSAINKTEINLYLNNICLDYNFIEKESTSSKIIAEPSSLKMSEHKTSPQISNFGSFSITGISYILSLDENVPSTKFGFQEIALRDGKLNSEQKLTEYRLRVKENCPFIEVSSDFKPNSIFYSNVCYHVSISYTSKNIDPEKLISIKLIASFIDKTGKVIGEISDFDRNLKMKPISFDMKIESYGKKCFLQCIASVKYDSDDSFFLFPTEICSFMPVKPIDIEIIAMNMSNDTFNFTICTSVFNQDIKNLHFTGAVLLEDNESRDLHQFQITEFSNNKSGIQKFLRILMIDHLTLFKVSKFKFIDHFKVIFSILNNTQFLFEDSSQTMKGCYEIFIEEFLKKNSIKHYITFSKKVYLSKIFPSPVSFFFTNLFSDVRKIDENRIEWTPSIKIVNHTKFYVYLKVFTPTEEKSKKQISKTKLNIVFTLDPECHVDHSLPTLILDNQQFYQVNDLIKFESSFVNFKCKWTIEATGSQKEPAILFPND